MKKHKIIVKRINATWPRSHQRCQAEIKDHTKQFRDYMKADYYCMREARYCVNGIFFCALHGGQELLDLLSKEENDDRST